MEIPKGLTVNTISNSGTQTGNQVSWSVPSLGVGDALSRTVEVSVDPGTSAGSTLSSFANLRHDGGLELDRQVTAAVSVNSMIAEAEINVSSTTGVGQTLTAAFTISNTSSNGLVNNLWVQYNLPEGITLQSVNDASPSASSRTTCDSSGFCNAGDEVFWNFTQLAAGATETITLDLTVTEDVGLGSLIHHALYVVADDLADVIQINSVTLVNSP